MHAGRGPGLHWVAARFTDTGPLLRLESQDAPLSKAARYGHPFARAIHASSLPPAAMSAIVQSFLECGLQGTRPKRGGFSWDELHALNQQVRYNGKHARTVHAARCHPGGS